MSTTVPTQSVDDHVSPTNAFDRLVWDNPRVCNGCFEHVKEIQEATFNGGMVDHDVQDHHRTPMATLEQDERVVADVERSGSGSTRRRDAGDSVTRPGQQRSSIARTTCRNCARVGCWADDRTLSKIEALQLVTPLAARLAEANITFDESVLREFVRLGKEGKYHSYDTEIFRGAVKTAMKRA